MQDPQNEEQKKKERLIKQLKQVVCICKGIDLGKVLKGLPESENIEDVNRKVGTGNGPCCGQRCGPKIKALLEKRKKSTEE
mgnify:CR=1 FL=1